MVSTSAPRDMNDLTQRITQEADAIKQNPRLVKRAVRDMIRRARYCIEKDGGHVKGHSQLT